MCTECRPLGGRGVARRLALCAVSVLLAGWGPAWAANVYINVNCGEGETVNGALEPDPPLDKTDHIEVTITGTCVEAVVVEGFKDLNLSGDAIIQRPVTTGWPGKSALEVWDSGGVTGGSNTPGVIIHGLTFRGLDPDEYRAPVVRILRSKVNIWGCTIGDNGADGGTGLDIGDHSAVSISGTTIENNQGFGLNAGGSSIVYVAGYLADDVIIQGNRAGVSATDDALVALGNVKIHDNQQSAVQASNAAIVDFGSWDPVDAAPDIYGNGQLYYPAVAATLGGQVWLGKATIHDNRDAGAGADGGGQILLCCGQGQVVIRENQGAGITAWAGGTIRGWLPVLVEGNLGGGVLIQQGSEAEFGTGTVIRSNGDSTDPDSFGGLFVDNSSALSVGSNATVADNYGPGVFLRGNSSATFWENASITGNQGYGVLLELSSSATFGDTVNASGNRKFDLVCTSGSVAGTPQGSHPSIARMKCPEWYQLQRLPD